MGIVPLAPEEWVEVSEEGAVSRRWNWDEDQEMNEGKESHEEMARWTVVGRLGRVRG